MKIYNWNLSTTVKSLHKVVNINEDTLVLKGCPKKIYHKKIMILNKHCNTLCGHLVSSL